MCSKYSEKNCLHMPTFTRCFKVFRISTCFINHFATSVFDICGQWFIGPVPRMQSLILQLLSVKTDHKCFIEVITPVNISPGDMFSTTQNIYVWMRDACLRVHTFSGQNDLDFVCKWAFDHPVNEEAIFIAHNNSNYDAHYIYCLI